METLKVGLIATGGRGVHGYEMHRPEKGVEIVAGCDIAQAALDKFTEKFPEAQTFTDYRDLLKIYHPDNIGGDTYTIQEINREYDCLKQRFA